MGNRGKKPQPRAHNGPREYPVPEGTHAGGKSVAELTSQEKAAVIELGLTEDEWDTSTWKVKQDHMSKMRPAEGRAVTALGFDSKSWYLYCCIVRSKYADWLKRIEDASRQAARRPAGEDSSGKRAKHGRASRSGGAASTSAAAVDAGADGVIEGTAVVERTTSPPPQQAGPSPTLPCQTVPHNAIPCHTIPYPTISYHSIP